MLGPPGTEGSEPLSPKLSSYYRLLTSQHSMLHCPFSALLTQDPCHRPLSLPYFDGNVSGAYVNLNPYSKRVQTPSGNSPSLRPVTDASICAHVGDMTFSPLALDDAVLRDVARSPSRHFYPSHHPKMKV
ncbi:hypothetical protein NM688_g8814 [Phlebia brevispora]|uniref:Uncharacterized protein n=1 Tax=Phlebia brevispora TaxID=194682 RepID=A0ACC1RR77_9APHY|nr:hypothetical protein NM688_g8814 [Phlebia brevispora]